MTLAGVCEDQSSRADRRAREPAEELHLLARKLRRRTDDPPERSRKKWLRASVGVTAASPGDLSVGSSVFFETIGFARFRPLRLMLCALGSCPDVDGVTMNRDRLMAAPKATALDRRPP